MTAPRCRWHLDAGRCPATVAAPGVAEVPEVCPTHLAALEPWRARAVQGGNAEAWIGYMRRQAEAAEYGLRALGFGVIRPGRAIDGGRPVTPGAPERQ